MNLKRSAAGNMFDDVRISQHQLRAGIQQKENRPAAINCPLQPYVVIAVLEWNRKKRLRQGILR